jgi:hypothetical protein
MRHIKRTSALFGIILIPTIESKVNLMVNQKEPRKNEVLLLLFERFFSWQNLRTVGVIIRTSLRTLQFLA